MCVVVASMVVELIDFQRVGGLCVLYAGHGCITLVSLLHEIGILCTPIVSGHM